MCQSLVGRKLTYVCMSIVIMQETHRPRTGFLMYMNKVLV